MFKPFIALVSGCALSVCGLYSTSEARRTSVSRAVPPQTPPIRAKTELQTQTLRAASATLPTYPHEGTYATGKLAGSAVSNLYAWYLGHQGSIPKRLTVNWDAQLASLWARKYRMSNKPVVRATGATLVREYHMGDPGRMSLRQYQQLADQQSRLVCSSLNWRTVGAAYFANKDRTRFNVAKTLLVKRMCSRINGQLVMAYAMTELMPAGGSYSYQVMDFLLRNAGRRYVESLPALNDQLTSFGPFQFTSQAIYDIGTSSVLGGASKMNRALPAHVRIPSSVSLLRGDAHLRAASLFALHNVAVFAKRLDDRQLAVFERTARKHPAELAQLIATAHNKPVVAYRSGVRWLSEKQLANYRAKCPKASRIYATKTHKNFLSLVGRAMGN